MSGKRKITAEFAAARAAHERWMAKYLPVEREILAARARRLDNAARNRRRRARAFGDLCEATEGLAAAWRRNGTPLAEQLAWADGDIWTLLCLARYRRTSATRLLDAMRHAVKRPLYYAAENARRRALAADRRAIRRRTTTNPFPTREDILDAWTRRKESHAAAIRFGSLVEDLECYLDNDLRFDDAGNIVGRNGGVKRWLQDEIPALYLKYTTVMRYKAAARKLRQIVGVADPVPASAVVTPDLAGDGNVVSPAVEIVRTRAIWREVTHGVKQNPTALMARLDALLDPERIEEANMLAAWRERYENEITMRPKSRWWRKMAKSG